MTRGYGCDGHHAEDTFAHADALGRYRLALREAVEDLRQFAEEMRARRGVALRRR